MIVDFKIKDIASPFREAMHKNNSIEVNSVVCYFLFL